MAALFDEMHKHDGRMLGLYDEMSTLYSQLDSSSDRSQLLSLSNGGSWSRHFKNNAKTLDIKKTAFSIAGFIQPDYVVRMLEEDDYAGFNDRQLIVCPPEQSCKFQDLLDASDMTESSPQLKEICDCVSRNHGSCRTYRLTSEAQIRYSAYHDDIEERREKVNKGTEDANKAAVLSKAQGQCATLALILHVLEQAFLHLSHSQNATQPKASPDWSEMIEKDTIDQAIVLIEHFISQKFLLMPKEIVPTTDSVEHPSSQTSTPHIRFHNQHLEEIPLKYVKRFLKHPSPLKASEVCRKKCVPPDRSSNNKYPVSNAENYMHEVAEEGFGEATEEKHGRKTSLVFRKRPFPELGTHQKELLKKLRLSPHDYDNTPQSDTSQSADTQDSHQPLATQSETAPTATQSGDRPTTTHDHDQSAAIAHDQSQPGTQSIDQSKSQ